MFAEMKYFIIFFFIYALIDTDLALLHLLNAILILRY